MREREREIERVGKTEKERKKVVLLEQSLPDD